MAYLDIIPLADAKVYLRVDDTLTEDDDQITRMIKSALSQVEIRTQHYLFARDKSYLFYNYCVNVYDYPINTLVSPTDATVTERSTYNIYATDTSTNTSVVLNIGYADPTDIPQELVEVAYEMIDIMYYEHETGKKVSKDLSSFSIDILNNHKRFIL